MVATRRLSELTGSTLTRLHLPPGRVTVALSGGADSAALALLISQSGVDASAVHIHHGFDASDALASAARAIAADLGLEVEIVEVELEDGPSREAMARNARYEALRAVPGPVLTAHTRDDTVETMLINLIRGTGVEGMTGIPEHRPPNIHRPLLAVTRSETREIALLAGLAFRDDPMNYDLDLTRNRVRRSILPLMRDLNPQLDEAMARLAHSLGVDAEYLDRAVSVDPEATLACSVVTTLPRALGDRLLRRWMAGHGIEVSAGLLDRVRSVAEGNTERQDMTGGRSVVRHGAMLVVE